MLSVLNKISDEYIECFEKLEQAASQTHTDYLLIGATARDLIMESVYGIKAKRQTLRGSKPFDRIQYTTTSFLHSLPDTFIEPRAGDSTRYI